MERDACSYDGLCNYIPSKILSSVVCIQIIILNIASLVLIINNSINKCLPTTASFLMNYKMDQNISSLC